MKQILIFLALMFVCATTSHGRDLTPMITLCDQVWSNMYFGQVELKDYPFCKNRWIVRTNHEKIPYRRAKQFN